MALTVWDRNNKKRLEDYILIRNVFFVISVLKKKSIISSVESSAV